MTEDEIYDVASIRTYFRSESFEESDQNEDILCKPFDQLASGDDYTYSNSVNLWKANKSEPRGFRQTYTAPADGKPGQTAIQCALRSERAGLSNGFAYKTGETIGVRAGYKIRESKDDLSSIFMYDKDEVVLVTLTVESSSSAVDQMAASVTFVLATSTLLSLIF